MRKLIYAMVLFTGIFLYGCKEDEANYYSVTITFDHVLGTSPLHTNDLIYTNEAGNIFSVEKLQYLVSRIVLHHENGNDFELKDYQFVDIADVLSLSFTSDVKVEEGVYDGISFTFGFNEDDNISGEYPDLNLANWNWPDMLGGGYHFMKFEGKFIDNQQSEVGFATHMGTAREIDGENSIFHANHFEVNINQEFTIINEQTIEIEMDLLNWYKNPNTWDLNTWGTMIMPNYEAQIALNQNGWDVFSINVVLPD